LCAFNPSVIGADSKIQASPLSGIAEECILAFQDLNLRKKYKFIIYKLSPDLKQIVVDKMSTSPDYETFLSNLPEYECRYAVCDVDYLDDSGDKRNKICFFTWYVASTQSRYILINVHLCYRTPDDAKLREKMVFASSKSYFVLQLGGMFADF
jgi:cofilin